MTALIEWLIGGAWQFVAPIIAALIAGLGLYAKGRSDAKAKAAAKDAKAALKTHERISDAHIEKDPEAARAILRAHAERLRSGKWKP